MTERNTGNLINSRDSEKESVHSLLSDLKISYPDNVVLKIYAGGDIYEYSAESLVNDVTALGTVFLSMSLMGKTVAIAGANSYYWLVTYLATVSIGASALIVDPKLSPTTISQQLKQASTELAVCDSDCYKKISDRSYNSVVMLDDNTTFAVQGSIRSLLETGYALIADGYGEFSKNVGKKGEVAHIAFDSGAYGRDKAVTLSGRSLYSQIVNAADVIGESDVYITEHFSNGRSLLCAVAAVLMGNTAAFAEEDLHIYDAVDVLSPEMLILSPLSLRKYYTDIWGEAERLGLAQQLIKKIRRAIRLKHFGINKRNANMRWLSRQGIAVVPDILCFGNNIDSETAFGIHMMGVDLRCAYEAAECGIVTFTRKSDGKNTTLGTAIDDVYIRTNQLGHILVKADATMSGYLGEGMYPDHWIPTGDTGRIMNGHIVLENDPQKVYITESAKRVFPERLTEAVKKQIPYARTLTVSMNEGRLTLSIFFDADFIKLTGKYELKNIVATSVDGINKGLGEHEQITDIIIEDIA